MPLSSKISKEISEDADDVPEEIEHDLIKDSILEIANANFTISDEFSDLPMGQIRRDLAEDMAEGYEGKPVSRKSFSQRNWMNEDSGSEKNTLQVDTDPSDSQSDGEPVSDDEGTEAEGTDKEETYDDEGEEEMDDDEEISDDNQESNLDSEEEEENVSKKSKKSREIDINIFSSKMKNIDDDIKKGNAIKNQLLLWENLIECRIKLQKGLVASNRLMQGETFSKFQLALSPEESSSIDLACKGLIDLLENFIQLRECLLKKCPEYVDFKKGGAKALRNHADADEEITSESENEDEEKVIEKDSESEEEISPSPAKKRKTEEDYSSYLSQSFNNYKPFRDAAIQKWNDKTRLSSGKIGISKFAILEQSTLKQIEQILLDKDRLLKRTQTRRSKFPVLGKKMEEDIEQEKDDEEECPQQETKKVEDLDPEIFDDDDFYHKLLKDFIERKTSDITDPTQLGRQWTKLQKLRSKMKRKVDTRATKGRKLRYTVHNKLVSFMAPIPYSKWEDKVEQDLFRSLFGQASQKSIAPLQ